MAPSLSTFCRITAYSRAFWSADSFSSLANRFRVLVTISLLRGSGPDGGWANDAKDMPTAIISWLCRHWSQIWWRLNFISEPLLVPKLHGFLD
jgi:hypothetical protein